VEVARHRRFVEVACHGRFVEVARHVPLFAGVTTVLTLI
jgi:hypothetical protein